jgi:hypothetical protein
MSNKNKYLWSGVIMPNNIRLNFKIKLIFYLAYINNLKNCLGSLWC